MPATVAPLTGLSSMATRALLAELAPACAAARGVALAIESVGGVDAARRVAAGERVDLVILARDALEALVAAGHVREGSLADLVHSGVSVAVRAGAPRPDISTEEALKAAVLAAPTVGHSTGPSGVQLLRLFERWGIAPALAGRLVQAPAGTPVATLVARGDVALGFQQLSELIAAPGIDILGPLPDAVRIDTVFSAGIATACERVDEARAALAWLASPAAAEAKRRQGMQPA